jgi:hypothetical protein
MSRSKEPRRLVEYGDRLGGALLGALEAERAGGTDAARLAGIEAKLAARLALPASESPPRVPEPVPASPATPLFGSKAAWIVAGAAVLGAVALWTTRGASPTAPAPRADAPLALPAPVPERPAPPAPPVAAEPAIATVSPADLPTAREPLVAPSARTIVRAPSSTPEQAEGEEIALLARAHEALRGRPADSLALCREHEQRFASGHFAQEREAVAIEALVYLNRRAEAQRRLDAFRDRHPTSSHRAHLEELFSAPVTAPR